jgi:hypothetical protein
MTIISFFKNPQIGDRYAAGESPWIYDGETWVATVYTGANYGVVDGGIPVSSYIVLVDNGISESEFIDNLPVNGGTP